MNRLRDGGDDFASKRELQRLRNTPATAPSPEMKRRVWSALQASALRVAGARSRGFGVLSMRVLAMGATVIVLAGTAGAMIAGRWIAPALNRSIGSDDAGVAGPRSERPKTAFRNAGARARNVASLPVQPLVAPATERSQPAAALPAAPVATKAARPSAPS